VLLLAIPRVPADTVSLIANGTLLHAVFPPSGSIFAFNRPAWTIGVEMVCYFSFIVVAVMARPLRSGTLVVLGVLSCYVGYKAFAQWSAPLASCSMKVGCGFQVTKYGGAFILGFGLYLLLRELDRWIPSEPWIRRPFAWASGVCLGGFVFYGVAKGWVWGRAVVPLVDVEWLWISAAWLATAYLSRQCSGLPKVLVPVYLAGVASYSIYLWHAIVLFLVDRNLESGWAYPGAVVATMALAYGSYRWVETPPRRWMARRVGAWFRRE
jgi:peptidoglycan/LPS O-acetylase OafA/YrhL